MAKPSYDALVSRVAKLEALFADQQGAAERAETAVWEPRGGEPRIIDADGKTLPYVPNLQFLGGVTLDTKNQRAVVPAPAGGGGGSSLINARSTNSDTTDRARTIFGPVGILSTASMSPGTVSTVNNSFLWPGTDQYTVVGAPRGPLGTENILWCFEDDPANSRIRFHFRNISSFYTVPSGWVFVFYVLANAV